jgi:hypothetical protein
MGIITDLFHFGKDQYIGVFLKMVGNIPSRIGSKKLNIQNSTISFKGKNFILNYADIFYRHGLKNYIFIDIEHGQIKRSDTQEALPMSDLVDLIVSKNIVGQLVSRLNAGTGFSASWVIMILLCVVGAVIGYFFGNAYPIEGVINATRNIKLW